MTPHNHTHTHTTTHTHNHTHMCCSSRHTYVFVQCPGNVGPPLAKVLLTVAGKLDGEGRLFHNGVPLLCGLHVPVSSSGCGLFGWQRVLERLLCVHTFASSSLYGMFAQWSMSSVSHALCRQRQKTQKRRKKQPEHCLEKHAEGQRRGYFRCVSCQSILFYLFATRMR